MKNILELMEQTLNASDQRVVENYVKSNGLRLGEAVGEGVVTREAAKSRIEALQEFIYAQMTGYDFKGERRTFSSKMNMQEALTSSDTSILFPRIINNILQEPKEPELFLTNSVAETLDLGPKAPLSIEFPLISALRAFDLAEGAEYQRDEFSLTQMRVGMRLGKVGVLTHVTEEVMEQSMWPIVTLYLRKMSEAINRFIEEKLYNAMVGSAVTVFDNESSDTAYRTTGVATNQAWNGSFSYFDLVKLMAVLLTRKYNGTHLLAHPLMWSVFAQDPLVMAIFFHGGQMGAGIWTREPQFQQQASLPLGIQYVPYYALAFNEQYTLTGAGSSLGNALVTSNLYVIDKSNSLFMATRGDIEVDDMDEWLRDSHAMKARKYVGIAVKDQGRGMVVAKKVRAVRNYEPLFTTRTVSS